MTTKRIVLSIGTLGIAALAATVVFPSFLKQSAPVTGSVLESDAGNEADVPPALEMPN
jgi:hypothetical protein